MRPAMDQLEPIACQPRANPKHSPSVVNSAMLTNATHTQDPVESPDVTERSGGQAPGNRGHHESGGEGDADEPPGTRRGPLQTLAEHREGERESDTRHAGPKHADQDAWKPTAFAACQRRAELRVRGEHGEQAAGESRDAEHALRDLHANLGRPIPEGGHGGNHFGRVRVESVTAVRRSGKSRRAGHGGSAAKRVPPDTAAQGLGARTPVCPMCGALDLPGGVHVERELVLAFGENRVTIDVAVR
jgi:hypothetical protein